MKAEQMELMKVIQFPQKKVEEKENRERKDKFEVAKKFIELLAYEGIDFHIVIDKESALKVMEDDNFKDYIIVTTNFEEAKKMQLKMTQMGNSVCAAIRGDEF